jgi:uncharacterized protein (TIGR03437 family)
MTVLTSAEFYGPAAVTFAAAPRMTLCRYSHTATIGPDRIILIAGGASYDAGPYQANLASVATAEIYTPELLVPAPVLLSLSGDGNGQGAILHANTVQLASSDTPAAVGDALEIYATGLFEGSLMPPQVAIGGRTAEVLCFGNTPGYAGLNQINVRVPSGIFPGPAVPVRISYIGRPGNRVTISVR